MSMPSQRFRDALSRWFLPGAVYTFVGAGGKTTAMKSVATFLAETGVKTRLTTTTRVGIDEFEGWTVSAVHGASELARALQEDTERLLLIGRTAEESKKYEGLDPKLIEALSLRADTVLLVEGDGSRRLPMKAPRSHEPVIPANSKTVFALMGASAFGEPIDEAHCYNNAKVLAVVGGTASSFNPPEIAALAANSEGCSKGVLPGMAFRLLLNQGDLERKRELASAALRLAREKHGIRGALVSFQKGELYDTTDD
jgi:probable selenium-dependent hydroxylase accessory protein YqeC